MSTDIKPSDTSVRLARKGLSKSSVDKIESTSKGVGSVHLTCDGTLATSEIEVCISIIDECSDKRL